MASFVSGWQPLIVKATSKSLVKDPWAFNVFWVGFGAVPAVLLGLFLGGGFPQSWYLAAALGFCHACFFILYTYAIFRIDVSTMAPLFSFRTIFAVIIGVVVLDETISSIEFGLLFVIVLISPLAAYDPQLKLKAFFTRPVLIAIVAMLSLAGAGYYTNRSSEINGYATTLIWQDVFTLAFLLPTLALAKRSEIKLSLKKALPFVLLGVGSFLYTVSATEAYRRNLALSSVIISLPISMVLVIVMSRKYPKLLEDHPARVYFVRVAAAVIMVSASIVLTVA